MNVAHRGKKYVAAKKLVTVGKHDVATAMKMVKDASKSTARKFDETVMLSVRLGVDPKHAATYFFPLCATFIHSLVVRAANVWPPTCWTAISL